MAAYTNQIVPFSFEGAAVRVADRDGQPWFVLADLCKVLEIGNPSQVVSRLDRDEKATLTNSEGQPGKGAQQFTIINESGLYRLIMVSRKPSAVRFRPRALQFETPFKNDLTPRVAVHMMPPMGLTNPQLNGGDANDTGGFPFRHVVQGLYAYVQGASLKAYRHVSVKPCLLALDACGPNKHACVLL